LCRQREVEDEQSSYEAVENIVPTVSDSLVCYECSKVSQTKILRNLQIILYPFNDVHVLVHERGLKNMCIGHV
jgi:hypothetical protein